jgi:hypothetical protein
VRKKLVEDDLSRVEESATKSTYKLGVGFERCEDKGEKSAPKFILTPTTEGGGNNQIHQSSLPIQSKAFLQPQQRSEERNPQAERGSFCLNVFGCGGHLDEFYFQCKRIEKRRLGCARNSYRDEFIDFPPHSYCHVPPCSYSCALSRTSSRALSHFSHEPNHRSYGFGSIENSFVPRRLGYDPRPHCGDHFPCRHSFPTGESYIRFELRHLDGPRFPRRGSRPTGSKGVVTNRGLEDMWLMDSGCSQHMTKIKYGSLASLHYHTRSM